MYLIIIIKYIVVAALQPLYENKKTIYQKLEIICGINPSVV